MKKIYIVTALSLASIVLVNAQQEGTAKNVPAKASAPKSAPIQVKQGVSMQIIKGGTTTPPIAQANQLPRTGDPVIDAQIQVLEVEMNAKIQATRVEYIKKIGQILAKERPTVAPTVGSSPKPGQLNNPGAQRNVEAGSKVVAPGIWAKLTNFFGGLFGN